MPAFALILRGGPFGMVLGYALIGVPLGSLGLTAFLAELFPTRIRYTGLSLTYGVASAVFGGTAPVLFASLAQRTGDLWAAVWYAAGVTAVAAVCALSAPETAHRPLDADL